MMYDGSGQMLLGRKPISVDAKVVEFVCWGRTFQLPIIERGHYAPSGESMFVRMGPVKWQYFISSRDDYGYFINSRGVRVDFAYFAEILEIADSASWATALIRSGDCECPDTKEEFLKLESQLAG